MSIIIRKALPKDIPVLGKMIPQSVRALSKGFYTNAQIEGAIQDIFGVDTQLILDQTYYIVGEKGIVGCGGWSKRQTLYGGNQMKTSKENNLLNPEREPARIRAFFIHPNWRRQGIGRRILNQCEQDALEAGFSALELVATLPGEPFYKALGFDVSQRYHIPLSNGTEIEAVRMYKKIR